MKCPDSHTPAASNRPLTLFTVLGKLYKKVGLASCKPCMHAHFLGMYTTCNADYKVHCLA